MLPGIQASIAIGLVKCCDHALAFSTRPRRLSPFYLRTRHYSYSTLHCFDRPASPTRPYSPTAPCHLQTLSPSRQQIPQHLLTLYSLVFITTSRSQLLPAAVCAAYPTPPSQQIPHTHTHRPPCSWDKKLDTNTHSSQCITSLPSDTVPYPPHSIVVRHPLQYHFVCNIRRTPFQTESKRSPRSPQNHSSHQPVL